MSDAGPAQYDTVELRRRIAGAFSAGELRALADSLGVGGINWDRGIQEAAREVVRQCERYAGLPALVARLREARPYLEWPDPVAGGGSTPLAAAEPFPADFSAAPPAPPSAPAIPPTNVYGAFPTLGATPGTFGAPGSLGATPGTLGAPAASAPAPAPLLSDPYTPAAAAPPLAPAPQPAPPPPRAGWPGTVGEAAPAARSGGIDPRIFVAVAGLMVVAAVIAYLAGRASSAPADATAAAAASASTTPDAAPRSGPAALAADIISRSYANLARICELPPSAGTGVYIFGRVAERCGPPPPPPRLAPSTTSTAPPADAPADAPTASADAPPPRSRRQGQGPAAAGDAPAASKGGCMGGCDAKHAACRAHCGPEPIESSAYDGYARCQGQCLRDASRCRLNCR